MEFTIFIEEPWGFESSDGENILKVRYLQKENKGYIFECISTFDNMTPYLKFQERCDRHKGVYSITKLGNDLKYAYDENLKPDFIGRMIGREIRRFKALTS